MTDAELKQLVDLADRKRGSVEARYVRSLVDLVMDPSIEQMFIEGAWTDKAEALAELKSILASGDLPSPLESLPSPGVGP